MRWRGGKLAGTQYVCVSSQQNRLVGFGRSPSVRHPAGDPIPAPVDTDFTRTALIMVATAAGSAVNSIAGGGTLITFPALVGLGVPHIVANATSTVALVPGSIGAFYGYRDAVAGARAWALRFAIPSVLGGALGAGLLLLAPSKFEAIVPWLVLGATALFVAQRPVMRLIKSRTAEAGEVGDPATRPAPLSVLGYQFLVGIYGGYFGAGIGILMLAALGFMGFTNIHRMNGLKSFGGTCANLTAAVILAASGLVDWRLASFMAVAGLLGGYAGSRLAQRVKQDQVRAAVVAIGFGSGFWMLWRQLT